MSECKHTRFAWVTGSACKECKNLAEYKDFMSDGKPTYMELEAENKRLKEALEFYRDVDYDRGAYDDRSDAEMDGGRIATEALRGKE